MSEGTKAPGDGVRRVRDYHPALDLVMPLLILVVSVGYAWSLWGIVEPELNLLLLRPIFAIIWVLLMFVAVTDVGPAIAAWARGEGRRTGARPALAEQFKPGTEGCAGLVVAATLVYGAVATNGPVVFIISTAVYLSVAAWIVGERRPLAVAGQGLLGTALIYLVMGVMLGVRF